MKIGGLLAIIFISAMAQAVTYSAINQSPQEESTNDFYGSILAELKLERQNYRISESVPCQLKARIQTAATTCADGIAQTSDAVAMSQTFLDLYPVTSPGSAQAKLSSSECQGNTPAVRNLLSVANQQATKICHSLGYSRCTTASAQLFQDDSTAFGFNNYFCMVEVRVKGQTDGTDNIPGEIATVRDVLTQAQSAYRGNNCSAGKRLVVQAANLFPSSAFVCQ